MKFILTSKQYCKIVTDILRGRCGADWNQMAAKSLILVTGTFVYAQLSKCIFCDFA